MLTFKDLMEKMHEAAVLDAKGRAAFKRDHENALALTSVLTLTLADLLIRLDKCEVPNVDVPAPGLGLDQTPDLNREISENIGSPANDNGDEIPPTVPTAPMPSEAEKTATLIKKFVNHEFIGEAALYKFSPPVDGHDFVILSAAVTVDHGVETYAFPAKDADAAGVSDWGELGISQVGTLSHEQIITDAGYRLVA